MICVSARSSNDFEENTASDTYDVYVRNGAGLKLYDKTPKLADTIRNNQ